MEITVQKYFNKISANIERFDVLVNTSEILVAITDMKL